MELQESWLVNGYFELASEKGRSFTQEVRDQLGDALGSRLRSKSYPTRGRRFWLWWRELEEPYLEAQFFAGLALEHPILSLGVSVEKGFEEGKSAGEAEWMDRRTWDWPRLVDRRDILLEEIRSIAERLRRPVFVKFHKKDLEGRTCERENRTFVHHGSWHRRHQGSIDVKAISSHIENLDTLKSHWIEASFCCELSPGDARGMTTHELAGLLLAFAPLRAKIMALSDGTEAGVGGGSGEGTS